MPGPAALCLDTQAPDVSGERRVPLTARRPRSAGPKGYVHVLIQNVSARNLTDVFVRSGRMRREFPLLRAGETVRLDVPAGNRSLVASAGTEHVRSVVCWDPCGVDKRRGPVITLSGAADYDGDIILEGDADAPPELTIKGAADARGRIVVRPRDRPKDSMLAEFPVVGHGWMSGFPASIIRDPVNRLIFFCGPQMNIGRAPACDWRVFSREAGSRGILVRDRSGNRLVIDESSLGQRRGIRNPVSRVHASLRWSGGPRFSVYDRSAEHSGRRGVFWEGVRLDSGWNRLTLPAKFTLGDPDWEFCVRIRARLVTGSDSREALCLQQLGCATGEVVVWQPAKSPFRCAQKLSAHWYPTWSRVEALFALCVTEGRWFVCKGNDRPDTRPLAAGLVLCSDEVSYAVEHVRPNRLMLVRG